MPTTPQVEFARGSTSATPKAGGIASAVSAVVGAVTGEEGWNGTVGGKPGFQKGNKYGANRGKGVREAGKAHTVAKNAALKAFKAHARSKTDAQRAVTQKAVAQAVRVSAKAHRELQAARAAQPAARNAARREARTTAKATPAANPAQSHGPASTSTSTTKASTATPKPTAGKMSDALANRAHVEIEKLKTFVGAGLRDNDQLLTDVDRLARGMNKAELFEAAKRAGIDHQAKTKKDLVDAIKNHVFDHKLATLKAKTDAARPQPITPSTPRPASGPAQATGTKPQPASTSKLTPVPQAKVTTSTAPNPAPVLAKAAQVAQRQEAVTKARQALGQAVTTHQVAGARDRADDLRAAVAAAGIKSHDREGLERIAEAHLRRHANRQATSVRPIGRDDAEKAHHIDHDGVRFHFTSSQAGLRKASSAFAQLAGGGEHIPAHISRHTSDVFLTTHEAQRSHNLTGFGRIKAAANGKQVAHYGTSYDDDGHANLAHEFSHNFAKHLYGSTTPSATSDFERARRTGEAPANRYGGTSAKEDFATSFEAYYRNKNKFRQSHPERFAVVDRLVRDASYGG